MSVQRLRVLPTPAKIATRRNESARQTLRAFAQFVDRHDPAALVDDAPLTLETCARIDAWFRRYVAALPQESGQ